MHEQKRYSRRSKVLIIKKDMSRNARSNRNGRFDEILLMILMVLTKIVILEILSIVQLQRNFAEPVDKIIRVNRNDLNTERKLRI